MLRLRTSTGLSVLALATGIAGTIWLSNLTSRWAGQPAHAVAAQGQSTPRSDARPPLHRQAPVSVAMPRRQIPRQRLVDELARTPTATVQTPIQLTPLATPSDNSQPWYKLQGHLDGRVVLHLTIDGDGRVRTAAMRESSGDPILDEHALRSVSRWRFAVPADHPDGLSGDLPMRFASRHAVASTM